MRYVRARRCVNCVVAEWMTALCATGMCLCFFASLWCIFCVFCVFCACVLCLCFVLVFLCFFFFLLFLSFCLAAAAAAATGVDEKGGKSEEACMHHRRVKRVVAERLTALYCLFFFSSCIYF